MSSVFDTNLAISQAGGAKDNPDPRILSQEIKDLSSLPSSQLQQ
jgi:hypothetical protein